MKNKPLNQLNSNELREILAYRNSKQTPIPQRALETPEVTTPLNPDTTFNPLESFHRGASNALTFGFMPKVVGAVGSPIAKLLNPEMSWSEAYAHGRDKSRMHDIESSKQNPKSYLGGEIAVSLGLPFPVKTLKGVAGLSGAYGAAHGLGSNDEGKPLSLSANDALGALYGGTTGAALGSGAHLATKLASPIIAPLFQKVPEKYKELVMHYKKPASKEIQEAIEIAKQNKTPFTEGQLTRNRNQLLVEENAAQGYYGDNDQRRMLDFYKRQKERFPERIEEIKSELGGSLPNKGVAARELVDDITTTALNERKVINQAYDEAANQVGAIKTNKVKDIPNLIRKDLESNVIYEDDIPKVKTILGSLDKMINKSDKLPFQQIESWRQGLNRTIYESEQGGQTRYALNDIKSRFDNYLDDIVEEALKTGDELVLNKFKTARSLNAQWAKKYHPEHKSEFGKTFLKKIIDNARYSETPYTDEMLVNEILGVSKLGFSQQSAAIVKEVKSLFPKADQLIKAEVTHKLFGDNPASFSTNLDKFKKDNPTLAKTVYTKEDMQALEDAAKYTHMMFSKPISGTNPSGTADRWWSILKSKIPYLKDTSFLSPIKTNEVKIHKSLMKGTAADQYVPKIPQALSNVYSTSIINNMINNEDRLANLSGKQLESILNKRKEDNKALDN